MFVHTGRTWCGLLIGSALSLALASLGGAAGAQTPLPEVVVTAPKQQPKPKPRRVQVRAGGGRDRASYSGRAAQRQGRRLRRGAKQPFHHDRHDDDEL